MVERLSKATPAMDRNGAHSKFVHNDYVNAVGSKTHKKCIGLDLTTYTQRTLLLYLRFGSSVLHLFSTHDLKLFTVLPNFCSSSERLLLELRSILRSVFVSVWSFL